MQQAIQDARRTGGLAPKQGEGASLQRKLAKLQEREAELVAATKSDGGGGGSSAFQKKLKAEQELAALQQERARLKRKLRLYGMSEADDEF